MKANNYISISRTDLETVCKAILDSAVYFEYREDLPDLYTCRFCSRSVPSSSACKGDNINHSMDCEFLVARDICPHSTNTTTTKPKTEST